MKKHLYSLTCLALICACSSTTPGKALIEKKPDLYSTKITLVGENTYLVNNNYISLNGVTPLFYSQKCLDANGSTFNCGIFFLEEIRKHISKSKSVRCYYANSFHHSYIGNGTVIPSTCYVNGVNLNEYIVLNGLGLSANDLYNAPQSIAKNQRKGLWSGKFMHPVDYGKLVSDNRDANRAFLYGDYTFFPQNNRVDCSIKAVVRNGDKIYLTMGSKLYEHVEVKRPLGDKIYCTEQEALENGFRKSD